MEPIRIFPVKKKIISNLVIVKMSFLLRRSESVMSKAISDTGLLDKT